MVGDLIWFAYASLPSGLNKTLLGPPAGGQYAMLQVYVDRLTLTRTVNVSEDTSTHTINDVNALSSSVS